MYSPFVFTEALKFTHCLQYPPPNMCLKFEHTGIHMHAYKHAASLSAQISCLGALVLLPQGSKWTTVIIVSRLAHWTPPHETSTPSLENLTKMLHNVTFKMSYSKMLIHLKITLPLWKVSLKSSTGVYGFQMEWLNIPKQRQIKSEATVVVEIG